MGLYRATGGLKAMGKGILSGVFWGIVASILVAVVLTALSPLPRDQAIQSTPDEPTETPAVEPAAPQTVVSETTTPETDEETSPSAPDGQVQSAPVTPEPAPEPEAPLVVEAKPEEPPVVETMPEEPPVAEITSEAPQPPETTLEAEAPEKPQVAEAQPDPAVNTDVEPESEAAARPEPLPEMPQSEAPVAPGEPVDLPAPTVVAELAVPEERAGFDVAPETTVPSLDQAALSEGAVPGLPQSATADVVPSAPQSVPARPRALDGPELPSAETIAGMSPETSIAPDGEVSAPAQAPTLAQGDTTSDLQPGVLVEPGPRPGTVSGPEAPAFDPVVVGVPTMADDDTGPPPAGDVPERVALATDQSDEAPGFDTSPAVPQAPKAPKAPAAAPEPTPAETTPAPKAAPAPKPADVTPEVAVTESETAPATEVQPSEKSADLPQVVAPGSTRPGGLPKVRRLGQLGSSSIGVGKAGPGLSQRMPRIATSEETPEIEVVPEPESETPVGALERNSVGFEDDSGRPLMALVVVGDGDAASLVSRIDGLGGQVTVALDPAVPALRAVAPDLKTRGHEVLIIAQGLPANATPRDVEVTLYAYTTDYPDAVGILLPPDGAIATDRALLKQAMEFAAASGHVVVTAQSGLDTAGRIAQGAGARALGVYRRLDGDGENASTVTRMLDRATFQAARDGNVAVLGGLGDQTVAGLTAWRAGLRGESVVLAPLSALVLGGT